MRCGVALAGMTLAWLLAMCGAWAEMRAHRRTREALAIVAAKLEVKEGKG